jgi:hypothetical protein
MKTVPAFLLFLSLGFILAIPNKALANEGDLMICRDARGVITRL